MEKHYINNDNNRVENPCLTQGEDKKRVRRGEEEGKKRGRRGREEAKHDESWVKDGLKQRLRLQVLRVAAVLGIMIMMPFAGWGQSEGVYYIDNNTNHSQAVNNRYYLIPADDPQKSDKNDAFYSSDYSAQNGDPEKPFLTTYKTNKDQAVVPSGVVNNLLDNSVWIWKAVSGEPGYYYIIHASSGKYVVYEPPYSAKPNRKSMHLLATDSPGNNAKFQIVTNGSGYNIRPKNAGTGNEDNRFLNPSGSNQDYYYGNGGSDNPAYNYIGLIGLWKEGSGNSIWYTETAICKAPDITYDGTIQQYNITWHDSLYNHLPADYKIYYTINEEEHEYTGPFTASECILRAWVVGYGMVLSETAEENLYTGTMPPTFEVTCDDGLVMNCATEGASIYYRINDVITVFDPGDAGFDATLYEGPISGDSSIISGCPSNCPKVYAFAFHNGSASAMVDTTYRPNTEKPVITLTDASTASISFVAGATLYYTTNGNNPDPLNMSATGTTEYTGSSPLTIYSLNPDNDLDLRVIAKIPDRGASCPVTVMKRPKKPSINAYRSCNGSVPKHLFKINNTVSGRFYYYAIRRGTDPQPATNEFLQYTSEVNFTDFYNDYPGNVVIYAYSEYPGEAGVTAEPSSISSHNYNTVYPDVPTFSYDETNLIVTITASSGTTIDYTVNGTAYQSTGSSVVYNLVQGQNYVFTATAVSSGQSSCPVTYHVYLPNGICSQSELASISLSGTYKLTCDITISGEFSSIGTASEPFTGYFDGGGHIISGLKVPLFGVTNGDAIVHDINLKEVEISQGGNVGALVCEAKGNTRIYNCGIRPSETLFDSKGNVTGFTGSTVSSEDSNCGSIVGLLDGTARVINCFSFANIEGGTIEAGIVGKNNQTSTMNSIKTIVVNCMYYGEITGTGTKYPVYGGTKIENSGNKAINNYNYYRGEAAFDDSYSSIDNYNRSWPAAEKNLRRFEYYRSILNSNRRLCTWWVAGTNEVAPTDEDVKRVGIAKWVIDPSIAPFPILKHWGKYPSIINQDPEKIWDGRTKDANGNTLTPHWVYRDAHGTDPSRIPYQGKKLGQLTVTIKTGHHPSEVGKTVTQKDSLMIYTDIDTLNYDYCYGKLQLPYYNEVFGNPNSDDHVTRYYGNYTDSVVTGWKITALTTMTGFTDTVCFVGSWDPMPGAVRYRKSAKAWESGFNYADRKCTSKDLYNTSGRVFAQGGYYYVPDSVTSIIIEAYWGKAFYLQAKDNYLDRVDVAKTKNYGYAFTPAGKLPTELSYNDGSSSHSIPIYNEFDAVMSDVKNNETCSVYDQAIVLMSNFPLHAENDFAGSVNNQGKGGVTLMSADLDMDNEPDFCFPFQWRAASTYTRYPIMPFRFDFLPIPELGMAMRHNQYAYSIGIFVPKGHFEITETAFIYTTQFEYMAAYQAINHQKPLILNGGQFEQIVCHADNPVNEDYTSNIIMGGHIWMNRFTPGSHAGKKCYVRHCAVSVMGGDFPEFYLSGLYRADVNTSSAYNDSPHCYTNGGRFGIMAGAATESVKKDVVFKIDHSIIGEFYGGGCNSVNNVEGNIDVTINHSLVLDKYCGGPKVGEMEQGKNVTTKAMGTHFCGNFFGGGNGGTNLFREQLKDETPSNMPGESDWRGDYGFDAFNPVHGGDPFHQDTGYYAQFEFEVFNQSNGLSNHAVARTYQHWAQFGKTRTGNITNTLTDCVIDGNYYGGGNLGNVGGEALGDKSVESNLINDTIYGNVFGAGFSAEIPTFQAHDKDNVSFPKRDAAGVVVPASIGFLKDNGVVINFKWCYKNGDVVIPEGVDPGDATTANPIFKYPNDATGKWYCLTTISLENLGAIQGNVTLTLKGNTKVFGSVYGGGDESAVTGNTTVKLQEGARVLGNVYGGGNEGPVGGDSQVRIQDE